MLQPEPLAQFRVLGAIAGLFIGGLCLSVACIWASRELAATGIGLAAGGIAWLVTNPDAD
jgi:hypothetical protein